VIHELEELQRAVHRCLDELTRIVRPEGIILAKCHDYVSYGELWPGTFYLQEHAVRRCGLEIVDRLEMIGRSCPQTETWQVRGSPTCQVPGSETWQVRARRNLATLLVLSKPAEARRPESASVTCAS